MGGNNKVEEGSGIKLLTENLRIDEKFIPKGKTEEEYERLYHLLKTPMRVLYNELKISAEWQLVILLDFLGEKNNFNFQDKGNLGNLKDNLGNTIAHYAAWSGNPKALKWVKENFSDLDLLTGKDNSGHTIAHYVAWSGNTNALEWVKDKVKDNFPALLTAKDNYGNTIAMYAAWSGNTNALEWVKDNFLALLTAKDNLGNTIAHYAAWSGNTNALEWVKDNFPALLTAKDNDGNTIAMYAALSGNPDIFNQALLLNGTPEKVQIILESNILCNEIASCILRALETNRTLMSVTFLGDYSVKLKYKIIEKLKNNQNIYDADFSFILKELKLLDETVVVNEEDKKRFNSVLNFHSKQTLFDAIKRLDKQYQIPLAKRDYETLFFSI